MPFIGAMVLFYTSAGTFQKLFDAVFYNAALAKVVCSVAMKEGLMTPLFARKIYVPMMHRNEEVEDADALPEATHLQRS